MIKTQKSNQSYLPYASSTLLWSKEEGSDQRDGTWVIPSLLEIWEIHTWSWISTLRAIKEPKCHSMIWSTFSEKSCTEDTSSTIGTEDFASHICNKIWTKIYSTNWNYSHSSKAKTFPSKYPLPVHSKGISNTSRPVWELKLHWLMDYIQTQKSGSELCNAINYSSTYSNYPQKKAERM